MNWDFWWGGCTLPSLSQRLYTLAWATKRRLVMLVRMSDFFFTTCDSKQMFY